MKLATLGALQNPAILERSTFSRASVRTCDIENCFNDVQQGMSDLMEGAVIVECQHSDQIHFRSEAPFPAITLLDSAFQSRVAHSIAKCGKANVCG